MSDSPFTDMDPVLREVAAFAVHQAHGVHDAITAERRAGSKLELESGGLFACFLLSLQVAFEIADTDPVLTSQLLERMHLDPNWLGRTTECQQLRDLFIDSIKPQVC